jgi:hypothetical protein
VDDKRKVYLHADLVLREETKALREAASSVIDLPKENDKQPDLLYFSAIFVSTGKNLNHAYFLPSELVKAEGTIVNKALDVEHKEEDIIGHIYAREFMTKKGEKVSIEELASADKGSLDDEEFHIAIAGIIYKNRFPNLAQEVADNKWCVSMEAYYMDYDVKIGEIIVSRKEAEALGLASDITAYLGKVAKIIKDKKELAEGRLTRVLRGIVFSGCGIVKNPANPPSVVLETAKNKIDKKEVSMDDVIVLDYDKLEDDDNNVTSTNVEGTAKKEGSNLEYDDTVGICVSYKKRVIDATYEGPDTKVLHEDWCTMFDAPCTSFSRDTTDPDCLYVKNGKEIKQVVSSYTKELVEKKNLNDKRNTLLGTLLDKIESAKGIIS